MNLFTIIEDGHAILLQRGVYKQTTLFERHARVYARHAGGFIGLRKDHGTTVPSIRCEHVEAAEQFAFDELGRMIVE